MQHEPVEIRWHDAHTLTSTWTEPGELDAAPRLIHSCGYLLSGVKAGHHVIAQSLDEGHVDSALAIPDGMVIDVVRLSGSRFGG